MKRTNDKLKTVTVWLAVTAICAFALNFRSARLEERPMHGDEANQAVRAGDLMDTGVYRYDPTDHHGPVMYYAALPACRATAKTFADTTERNFRMVPVTFSILTLLLMALLYTPDRTGLFTNPAGVLTAILLTALSPAMNYYSRFFIQETLFVTFLTGMLVCAVHYVRAGGGTRKGAWMAAGFGVCLGLAAATKETLVLSLAAAALAALCTCGYRRLLNAWNTRDFLIMLGAAALVAVLFFSSFFSHPAGVYDAAVTTFGAYTKQAVNDDHTHPSTFYLQRLFWHTHDFPAWAKVGLKDLFGITSKLYRGGRLWSEAGLFLPLILLALAMTLRPPARAPATGAPRQLPWLRFVALYTLALTALYSAIPYKTPWCMLAFLHGYILMAGAGAGQVWEWQARLPWKWRWAPLALAAAYLWYAVSYQQAQTRRACDTFAADSRNPYVYAHTTTDALNLVSALAEAAQKADGLSTRMAIAAPPSDTWPLPWYLRRYTAIGYWQDVADIPEGFDPIVLIVSLGQTLAAHERFGSGKQSNLFGIRPSVFLNVFTPAPAETE